MKKKNYSKIKEPVRLRAKTLANGNRSLYLDTYCKGQRKYEFLRLYLIPEKTPTDKSLNAASLKAANAIKAKANIEVGDDIAAFLFCCFCGLRYSDVAALKWENVIVTVNGKEILIAMKKTKRLIAIPLSAQAITLLPSQGLPEANLFAFPSYSVTLRRLKKLAESAGIKKKVTFHVSRHTFATMMLTAGADLYTISKLVGHSDIRTTQIYSKVVDRRKRDAVALLDRLF